jgi:hypothetical protein
MQLLSKYWHEQAPVYDPFQVALTFLPATPPGEVVNALKARIISARGAAAHLKQQQRFAPPHVKANLDLGIAQLGVFCDWAERQLLLYR